MSPDRYGLPTYHEIMGIKPKRQKKRQLTNAQKIWIWDNNPHKCNICGKRVTKLGEAEFDHTKAYSKGGSTSLTNVKITHRACNRLKGTKSIGTAKKMMGGKKTTKKKTTIRKRKTPKKKKPSDPWKIDFNFKG
jgi:5-methylcytosine-specific restriction endonuclease McrA